jgi:ABC transport system ATP-binding/permease protein
VGVPPSGEGESRTIQAESGRRLARVGPRKVGAVAHLLGAEAVHLEYPTQVVFTAMTVGVGDGDRIGIVGRNGDGKPV